jgi:hypothetical protein
MSKFAKVSIRPSVFLKSRMIAMYVKLRMRYYTMKTEETQIPLA